MRSVRVPSAQTVEALLKREFDTHRVAETVHPLVKAYGLDLVPFQHEFIEEWRDSLRRGITYAVPGTNLEFDTSCCRIWAMTAGWSRR